MSPAFLLVPCPLECGSVQLFFTEKLRRDPFSDLHPKQKSSRRSVFAAPLRFVLAAVFLSMPLSLCLRGQTGLVHGSLSGTVIDTTGSAIAGAHVTLSSRDKTTVRSAATGPDGSFSILGLPSGAYRIEIVAPGFAPYENDSIAIAVGRNARIDAELAPAHASQQVKVQSRTEVLDTSQSSPVTNIDRDRIEELPIPSRNYLSFTLLAPSLGSANPALGLQSAAAAAGEGGFSAGGLRPSSNALYIDGVDDNDEYTGLSRTELSPEAISDFQVVNHGYGAQYGGSAGGSVDVETRSGANLQHGDAFLFGRQRHRMYVRIGEGPIDQHFMPGIGNITELGDVVVAQQVIQRAGPVFLGNRVRHWRFLEHDRAG